MKPTDNIQLRDENIIPDDRVMKSVLGTSFPAYQELLALFDSNQLNHTWNYYHDVNYWLCKVQYKKRTIVWMSTCQGYIRATLYFPEKYIDALFSLDISEARKTIIRETKNTGKSKPCTFEIRDSSVLEDFAKVMKFKLTAK